MDIPQYRAEVSACRLCSASSVVCCTPRFATGKATATVAFVGQNPPIDKDRCLHGAWMLHYKGEKYDSLRRSHERLMLELVEHLGITTEDIWATQASKCPTWENVMPYYDTAWTCAKRYLQRELAYARPKVVLAFGYQTGRLVADCYDSMLNRTQLHTGSWPCKVIGSTRPSAVHGWAHVLECPHPSIVDRFITKDSWLAAIKLGYAVAQTQNAPKLAFERNK